MTGATPWQELKAIFSAAIELPSELREPFLEQRCAANLSLLDQIRQLIQAHEQASQFLELKSDTEMLAGETSIESDANTFGHDVAGLPSRLVRHFARQVQELTPFQADNSIEWPPQLSDRYEFRRILGRGGMGVVALAWDRRLDRLVAIKLLSTSQIGSDAEAESARKRLEREAKSVAQIRSDHVITLHNVDALSDDTYALVMEFVEGPSLSELLLQRGSLSSREAAEIIRQAALGVHAAHVAGVVHRDIKPGNILLRIQDDPNRMAFQVKVSDFGLARFDAASNQLTQEGTLVGTPAYMSPEQVHDPQQIAAISDVYGLGVTLYRALTGEVPFRGAPHMVLSQIVNREPVSPRQLNDSITLDLESICLKAMAKDPADRYATAGELAEDLQRALDHHPIVARPLTPAVRLFRYARRNPRLAGLTVLATALVIMLTVGSVIVASIVRNKNEQLAMQNDALSSTNEQLRAAQAETEKARTQAQANAEQAEQVVRSFFFDVSRSQELLAGQPGTQALRAKLIKQARDYYEQLLAQAEAGNSGPIDPAITMRLAGANLTLGMVDEDTGNLEEAAERLSTAREAFATLGDNPEYRLEARRGFAEATGRLADVRQAATSDQQALELFAEARREFATLFSEDGGESNRLAYARVAGSEADLRRELGDVESSLTLYEDTIEELQNLSDPSGNARFVIAAFQAAHAGALRDVGRDAGQVISALKNAIEMAQSLWDEFPNDTHYLSALADYHENMASHLADMGKIDSALKYHAIALQHFRTLILREPAVMSHRRGYIRALRVEATLADQIRDSLDDLELAVEAGRELCQMAPDDSENSMLLATTLMTLAERLRSIGELSQARPYETEAAQCMEQVIQIAPTVDNFLQLAEIYAAAGRAAANGGDLETARRSLQTRMEMCRRAVEANPEHAAAQDSWAYALSDFGVLLFHMGQVEEAAKYIRQSVDVARTLSRRVDTIPEYRFRLAVSLLRLAGIEEQIQSAEEAEVLMNESVSILELLVGDNPQKDKYQSVLNIAFLNLADLLTAQDKFSQAMVSYDKAEPRIREMIAEHPDEVAHLEALAQLLNNRGIALRNLDRLDAAREAHEEYRALIERLIALTPDRRDYLLDLAYADENMGQLLRLEGKYQAAIEQFQAARENVADYLDSSPGNPDIEERLRAIVTAEAKSYAERVQRLFLASDVAAPISFAEARHDATKANELEEWKNPLHLELLADVLFAAGEIEEGLIQLRLAMEYAVDSERLRLNARIETMAVASSESEGD